MSKINSKKKGNRSELKIAKLLSDKIGGIFSRVPTSGAFGSTHVLTDHAKLCLCGDIIACSPSFLFSIENKSGYNIEINNLFKEENSTDKTLIKLFCEQALNDALNSNKIPMVIYSKDRRPPLCIIPRYIKEKERDLNLLLFCKLEVFMQINIKITVNDTTIREWIVFSLDELLDKAPKSFFFKDIPS